MRRMILGLCCLALAAAPAWAQAPIRDAAFLPVSHGTRGTACAEPCAAKVCVAVPTTIKHTHTCFSSKCLEYCLPNCTFSRGCDTSCADNSGPVRTKHVLMMRRVTHECPATTCEV